MIHTMETVMRYRRLAVIIAVMSGTSSSANVQMSGMFSWTRLESVLMIYRQNPTEKHALLLYNALPDSPESERSADTTGFSKAVEDAWGTTGILKKHAYMEGRNALRVCFKLIIISDAAFTEDLNQILGNMIRRNPTMFLEELKTHRQVFGDNLSHWFQDYGPSFVDSPEQERSVETKRRIRALQSVKDSGLAAIRDEVIDAFKKGK
jgi:hypothetical protein